MRQFFGLAEAMASTKLNYQNQLIGHRYNKTLAMAVDQKQQPQRLLVTCVHFVFLI